MQYLASGPSCRLAGLSAVAVAAALLSNAGCASEPEPDITGIVVCDKHTITIGEQGTVFFRVSDHIPDEDYHWDQQSGDGEVTLPVTSLTFNESTDPGYAYEAVGHYVGTTLGDAAVVVQAADKARPVEEFVSPTFCAITVVEAEPNPVPCAGTAIVFEDGEFDPADDAWTDAEVSRHPVSGVTSHTVEHQTSGGNPDAFELTTLTLTEAHSDIWVAHRYTKVGYDPGKQGAITGISMSIDVSSLGQGLSEVSMMAVQNGAIYWTERVFVAEKSGWVTKSDWTEADFVWRLGETGPQHPDFSTGGAPLDFGYLTGVTHNTGAPGTIQREGVDNWRVRLCTE